MSWRDEQIDPVDSFNTGYCYGPFFVGNVYYPMVQGDRYIKIASRWMDDSGQVRIRVWTDFRPDVRGIDCGMCEMPVWIYVDGSGATIEQVRAYDGTLRYDASKNLGYRTAVD